MINRKSLAQKINKVTQKGTIRTFDYLDAKALYKYWYEGTDNYEEELRTLHLAYINDKVLCKFKPYDDQEGYDTICQLNYLDIFIKDLIYEIIKL